MTTAIEQAREDLRRSQTDDSRYFLRGQFVFVLRGPAGQGPLPEGASSIQVPLVLNPKRWNYSMPFASELTAMQAGGIIAEENGAVICEITLEGTTGVALKTNVGDTSGPTQVGRFTSLDGGAANTGNTPLSGQLHFWRLARRIFDGYSELKKHPEHGPKTTMELHVLKDDLHLQVVPRSFELDKQAGDESRLGYRYSIRLAVVGPATSLAELSRSPDETLIQKMRDRVANMREGLQGLQAGVTDLTACFDDVRRVFTGLAGAIDDVGRVIDRVTDFVDGTSRFFDLQETYLRAVANTLDSAADLFAALDSFQASRDVEAVFVSMSESMDRILVAAKQANKPSGRSRLDTLDVRSQGLVRGTDPALDQRIATKQSQAATAQGRLPASEALRGVSPGDALRSQTGRSRGGEKARENERGFVSVRVNQGDTLVSIAAHYLGDPNRAFELAVLNRLKPPYITDAARLPGTVRYGGSIIVPAQEATQAPAVFASTSALTTEVAAQLYGRDALRVRIGRSQYDWELDPASDKTDIRKVEGVPNVQQALQWRTTIARGESPLYPRLGVPILIGEPATPSRALSQRFEMRQQILADPRVQQIRTFAYTVQEDAVTVNADVVLIREASASFAFRALES